ncbi:hypothetical protein HK405_014924 [Cladochytrium tenue]|nr:hypothetical protein HK405_014924 [Cladochytrium tenue]
MHLKSYRRMDRYLSAHMSLAGRRRLGTLLQLYEVASSAMVTRALLFEPVLARFAARWQARLLHRHDCPAVACVIAEDAGGGDIGSPVSATTSSLARLVTDTAGAAADRRALPAARPPPQSQSQQQPVAMWRRTGELLAGSHTLADCLGLPWSALNPANPATPAAMRDFSGASVSDASVAQPSGIHTDVATAAAVASLASGVTGRGPNYNFPPQEPAAVSADLAEAAPATAGAMTVYDWMTEESAVAYWEAFLAVAFGRGGGGGAAARGAVSAATSATAAPRAPSATLLPDAAVLRGLVLRVPWRGWGFTSTAGGSGGGGGSMAVAGACCRHCGGPASAATAQQQQHYVHPGGGGGGNGSRLGRRPSRFECVLAFRVRRTADGAAPLCVHGAFSFV